MAAPSSEIIENNRQRSQRRRQRVVDRLDYLRSYKYPLYTTKVFYTVQDGNGLDLVPVSRVSVSYNRKILCVYRPIPMLPFPTNAPHTFLLAIATRVPDATETNSMIKS
jgi:hypothetical protein